MGMSIEKKVGIFFLLSLIALGVLIELVEGWSPFQRYENYQAYFQSAVGIRTGDPVRLAGVEVGKVREITVDDGRIRVDFRVNEGTVIREDSIAEIRQSNLLGGQFLGIDFGSPTAPELPPGSTVSSREGTNIDELLANFDRSSQRVLGLLGDMLEESKGPLVDAMERVNEIVRRIDEGEGTLGRIVNDPRLYDDLQGAAANLSSVLQKLESGEGTLGQLMADQTLYQDATRVVANLAEITDSLREGQGTVGRLLNDEELYTNAADALAGIREITTKANAGTGTLGMLVNDDALYIEAQGALARINSIAGKIDEGQGTLGRLVNEDDLYRDARTTLNKVEKTVDGLSDSGPLSALGVVLGTLF